MKQIKRYALTMFFSFLAGFLVGYFLTQPKVEYVKVDSNRPTITIQEAINDYEEVGAEQEE